MNTFDAGVDEGILEFIGLVCGGLSYKKYWESLD